MEEGPPQIGPADAPAAKSSSLAAQASASLALLLREDRWLTQYNLDKTVAAENQEDKGEAAFQYAASLLQLKGDGEQKAATHRQRAEDALGEVERKLALVESLAERVSRTSPDAVAGPLLRLHGYQVPSVNTADSEEAADPEAKADSGGEGASMSPSSTLLATRDRCERLKRQGEVLEGIAVRVESSLQRGLTRMEKATKRLDRVLQLSAALKMILRLQFEANKFRGYLLDDLRDLTRAAASVAVVEDLLSKPDWKQPGAPPIQVVQAIRPQVESTAAAVRKAAAALLEEYHNPKSSSDDPSRIIQLGATLQVYYHLGELPSAAWKVVDHALSMAEKATYDFLSPTTLARLTETATTEAKISVGSNARANLQRTIQNKLRQLRREAAVQWTQGITEASLQVWNLHQVLARKTDPVSRQVFLDVVAEGKIPRKYQMNDGQSQESDFSIFTLYWQRLAQSLGDRLKHVLEYDNRKFVPDVANLYPAVRAATLQMLSSLHNTMQVGLVGSALLLEDAASSASNPAGLLGGSTFLNDSFLQWNGDGQPNATWSASSTNDLQGGLGSTSADTWTRPPVSEEDGDNGGSGIGGSSATMGSNAALSIVLQSSEWVILEGNAASERGLYRLQLAFREASSSRLCAPLEYMFPEHANVPVDPDGTTAAATGLSLLPSRYDIQKFDTNIRQELSLADPREGGGDLSLVTMISENIVAMIVKFCQQARNGVSHRNLSTVDSKTSAVVLPPSYYLLDSDGSATSALKHDVKIIAILHALNQAVQAAPEQVFVAPYRPAVTPQLEEAAQLCEPALVVPARQEIQSFVQFWILAPLCEALNERISTRMSHIHHHKSYLSQDSSRSDPTSDDAADSPSFVQTYLTPLYDHMSNKLLPHIPGDFSGQVATAVARYSMFAFVTHATLIRPLTEESTRLQITHDLADLELALEQMVLKSRSSLTLKDLGKPYQEFRALRQLLFWNDLFQANSSKSPVQLGKAFLRESWSVSLRPSTALQYIISAVGPSLLSSPHHHSRSTSASSSSYVSTLVRTDTGKSDADGENQTWMTVLSDCDAYRQRVSTMGSQGGDTSTRIPDLLVLLGPELLRRQRS